MGFCKPMSEEVPLINTKTISKEELDAHRENAAKVQAVLQSRYTDKPLACVITYGCQQNVADSEHIKGMLRGYGLRVYRGSCIRHRCGHPQHLRRAGARRASGAWQRGGAPSTYKAEHPDTVICFVRLYDAATAHGRAQVRAVLSLLWTWCSAPMRCTGCRSCCCSTLTRKKRVFDTAGYGRRAIAEGVPGRCGTISGEAWLPSYVRLQQLLHLLHRRRMCGGGSAVSTGVRCAGRGQAV